MTTTMHHDEFTVDLTGQPPPPFLWMTMLMDTVCLLPLQCHNWRETMQVSPDSWWALKVPSVPASLPAFLSFQDYYSQQQRIPGENEVASLWQAAYSYAFETSSTALGSLGTPTAALVLLCLVFLLRSIKSVLLPWFSSLGRWIGRQTHGVEWESQNEERIFKFGEYIFRLVYHSVISVYGIYYFWDKEWWAPGGTVSLFRGFPNHPVEPGMAWYYLLQAAYNFDAMLSLLLISFTVTLQSPVEKSGRGGSAAALSFRSPIKVSWSDTVRGDFREMMIHHLITNMLVVGSSYCRLTRIGSMVFLVHDVSDVPVDLSKLANFLKWKYTTLACFLSMVAVWAATRLYILPFVIYRAILTESQWCLQEGLSLLLFISYRHAFYVLVGLLIVLHMAWFVMFLQIFSTFLRKNECHDLSEHKHGEEQHADPRRTNNRDDATSAQGMAPDNAATTKAKQRLHDEFSEEKKDN